jgi:hypothetical protein
MGKRRPMKSTVSRIALLIFLLPLNKSIYAASGPTGQEYRDWSKTARAFFALGFLNGYGVGRNTRSQDLVDGLSRRGLFVGGVVDQVAQDETLQCLSEITAGQVEAILDKYLDSHPEQWDKDLARVAVSALKEACEKRSKNR